VARLAIPEQQTHLGSGLRRAQLHRSSAATPQGAIEQVMDHCDKDGDGISYKEFIDVLARDNARAHVLG